MTRIEIGGLAALVVAVITGAVAFGNLQGRISGIEREIDQPKKVMRNEGREIIEETESIRKDFERDSKSMVSNINANKSAILSIGENECKWMSYVNRSPLENIHYCPDGYYAKGLGFYHKHGQDYAYQMSYRLYCCSLK